MKIPVSIGQAVNSAMCSNISLIYITRNNTACRRLQNLGSFTRNNETQVMLLLYSRANFQANLIVRHPQTVILEQNGVHPARFVRYRRRGEVLYNTFEGQVKCAIRFIVQAVDRISLKFRLGFFQLDNRHQSNNAAN